IAAEQRGGLPERRDRRNGAERMSPAAGSDETCQVGWHMTPGSSEWPPDLLAAARADWQLQVPARVVAAPAPAPGDTRAEQSEVSRVVVLGLQPFVLWPANAVNLRK